MKMNRIKTLKKKEVCVRCETPISYSERFDSYYCLPCNVWLEERCVDPLCKACAHRPIRPICKSKIKPKRKKGETVNWKI
jgi:hypothetical protein